MLRSWDPMFGDQSAQSIGSLAVAPLRSAAQALEARLVDVVEDRLMQRKLTGRGQDGVRWPAQLIGKLTYLAGGLASDDSPPTEAEKEVRGLLAQQVAASQARLDEVLDKDLAAFNQVLEERKVPHIIRRTLK